jgi:hypothetical protein
MTGRAAVLRLDVERVTHGQHVRNRVGGYVPDFGHGRSDAAPTNSCRRVQGVVLEQLMDEGFRRSVRALLPGDVLVHDARRRGSNAGQQGSGPPGLALAEADIDNA